MKKAIFIIIICAIGTTKSLDIPLDLQRKIDSISDEIRIVYSSNNACLKKNPEQNFKKLLLFHVGPIHTYIITQATNFIPCLSDFYDELTQLLENNAGIESSCCTLYLQAAQNALFSTLDQAIVQNWNHPQLIDFIHHVTNISTIIYKQNQLLFAGVCSDLKVLSPVDSENSEVRQTRTIPKSFKLPSHPKNSSGSYPRLRLKELLTQHNLTVAQLADRCGLSRAAIYLFQNGTLGYTYFTLQKLSNAFEVPIKDLFVHPEEFVDNFGLDPRIQKILQAKNWTIYQLSAQSGLSCSYICNIKNVQNCSTSSLNKIACALGVTPQELCTSSNGYSLDLDQQEQDDGVDRFFNENSDAYILDDLFL